MLRNIHTRPIFTNVSGCLPVSKKDGSMFRTFERRVLRMIYGPVNDNGIWRTRYSNELYTFYDELDIVKVINMGRLRWLGQHFRMQELDPCRKLPLLSQKVRYV
jgi:hypothetical protein